MELTAERKQRLRKLICKHKEDLSQTQVRTLLSDLHSVILSKFPTAPLIDAILFLNIIHSGYYDELVSFDLNTKLSHVDYHRNFCKDVLKKHGSFPGSFEGFVSLCGALRVMLTDKFLGEL